jgi:hypothetical protein
LIVELHTEGFSLASPEAIDGAAAAESREPGQGLATVGVIVGSADPNIRIYILQDLLDGPSVLHDSLDASNQLRLSLTPELEKGCLVPVAYAHDEV